MHSYQILLGSIKHIPKKWNDGLTFILMLRGTVTLECEGEAFELIESDIAVINDGDFYSLTSNYSNIVLLLRFPKEYVMERFSQFLSYRFQCISSSSSPSKNTIYDSMRKYVAELAFHYFKNATGAELLIQSRIFKIFHLLLTEFAVPSELNTQHTNDQRLKQVLDYIHIHYKQRIQLIDIAKRSFLSPQHLSRLFKTELNTTFLDYVHQLRVASATKELLHSDETVTKIAMNNGFASDKAMNQAFINTYGMTPNEYRKSYTLKVQSSKEGIFSADFLSLDKEHALEDLVRFIDQFERGKQQYANPIQVFNLDPATCSHVSKPKVIVDIGDITYALRENCRKQLKIAKEQLDVTYVSFGGILQTLRESIKRTSPLQRYDIYDIFSLFSKYQLVPFVRIELDYLQHLSEEEIHLLLATLADTYANSYTVEWYFEIIGNEERLQKWFPLLSTTLRHYISNCNIGLRVSLGTVDEEQIQTQQLLVHLAPYQPNFLSVSIDPNKIAAPNDPNAYEQFHRYYLTNQVQRIRMMTDEVGMQDVHIFLNEWNTITGSNPVEAGEFHRTALLVDSIWQLSTIVTGISIRLSLDGHQETEDQFVTYPLSLFIYRTIRRPMFFAFKAYASLKSTVIEQGDGYLLSCDAVGNVTVLFYNACYISPFQSLDNIRQRNDIRTFSCRLTGFSPGTYRIKKHFMDKNHGSIYSSWLKMDLSVPLHKEDMEEYLESVSNPSVMLYEETSDGDMFITQELSMNAITLFQIKKIN